MRADRFASPGRAFRVPEAMASNKIAFLDINDENLSLVK